MPITLSHLAKDRRTVTIEYEGEKMTVTYRPSGYTPKLEEEVKLDNSGNFQTLTVVKLLSAFLMEWELLDEKGKQIKPTAENLKTLPLTFLVKVLDEVVADMRPQPMKAESSTDG